MSHAAIKQILQRVEKAKEDSDFTYFHSLLLFGEALLKSSVIGFITALDHETGRNRYRLEYSIARADGLRPWYMALEDALSGASSQFLLTDFNNEKQEYTKICGKSNWQYDSVANLKICLDELGIETEEVPAQTDLRRWFSLFVTLRNKTRGHGATLPGRTSTAVISLNKSLEMFYLNASLYKRPWAFLYRNLSGKYRISQIAGNNSVFSFLKTQTDKVYSNGVYLFISKPCLTPFLESDVDLSDFFFANGSFSHNCYESISFATDNRKKSDGSSFVLPPGTLPSSETQGLKELDQLGNCFSNVPILAGDYIPRPSLESEIRDLLLDDRRLIVTLHGSGGIGKTSSALKVLKDVANEKRFQLLIWFSARDVDLTFSGPKVVQPHVTSIQDMSDVYGRLVTPERFSEKGFSPRAYFEKQLEKNENGPCLYIFDNFETTQSPLELYQWLDTFVRLPNKVLITTRLREFKGDYPVEVNGMSSAEARQLINLTAKNLNISHLLNDEYVKELIHQADGHPYVIKILLGEVAKEKRAGNIPRLVANRDEILTALFERTYSSLSPCAQRIFMTLAAWNSAVPRLALEAVLFQDHEDRAEVERSVDALLKYSLAERFDSIERNEFIGLPLTAAFFGKKKLNISPLLSAIKSDVETLQMFGPVGTGEIHISLEKKVRNFISVLSRKLEKENVLTKYLPIIEMIARNFPITWFFLARLYVEQDTSEGYERAKAALRLYLEQDSKGETASEAWKELAYCCYKTGDQLGNVHAFIQRAKITTIPFLDLDKTAKLLNDMIKNQILKIASDDKRALAQELLVVMEERKSEANADNLGQMAWLALRLNSLKQAATYVVMGLKLEPENYHLQRLAEKENISRFIETKTE